MSNTQLNGLGPAGDFGRAHPNPEVVARAILIGDKVSDIEADNAVGTTVLLRQEAVETHSRKLDCHVFRSLVDIQTSFFLATS